MSKKYADKLLSLLFWLIVILTVINLCIVVSEGL